MQVTSKHKLIEALHEECSPKMIQMAFRATGDYHLAQDLVQETFLTATLKIDQLVSHQQPYLWLYKTLYYILQREQSRAYHSREFELIEGAHASKGDISEKLEYMLPKGLSDDERELLILRFDNNWSFEQMAEYLGISQVACRKRMSRAMEHCKKLLEKIDLVSQKPGLTGLSKRR